MKLNRTPNPLDRLNRTGLNENWDIIEGIIGNPIDSGRLEDGAATFEKRSRLGEVAIITIGSDGGIPEIITKDYKIIFPSTFFIVNGNKRYRIESTTLDYSEAKSGSTGVAIFFDTEDESFLILRQTQLDVVKESSILFAFLYFESGTERLIGVYMNCRYNIDGLDSGVYFADKIPLKLLSRSGTMPFVTLGSNTDKFPNFDTKNKKITFYNTFFIFMGKERYTSSAVEIDFSHINATGVAIYYDTESGEFITADQRDLNVPDSSILFAVAYRMTSEIGWKLLMNGNFTIDGETERHDDKELHYKFNNPMVLEDLNTISSFPGVGDAGSPFNYDDDDHTLIYGLFDNLMDENPSYITKKLIGESEKGVPIYNYTFTPEWPSVIYSDSKKFVPFKPLPKIIIGGAIHGRENLAVTALYYFFDRVCNEWKQDKSLEYLRHNIIFTVTPLQNPDDFDGKFYNGENEEGINLNRDFDWKWTPDTNTGSVPFERVESRVIRDFLFENDDAIHFIDCHVRGGRRLVEDKHMMWLGGSTFDQAHASASTIIKLSNKWKKEYTQLPNIPHYGYGTLGDGPRTVRGYAQFVVGIESTLWEGFSMSNTFNQLENDVVVNLNIEFLTQYVIDVIRYYQDSR